jgi:hypothetical protein
MRTLSRPLIALAAAFFASGVSFAPALGGRVPGTGRGTPPAIAEVVGAEVGKARAEAAMHGGLRPASPTGDDVRETDVEVPRDLHVDVVTEGPGRARIVVRRPGYLVAIRQGAVRAAGKDWAELRVGSAGEVGGELTAWETTHLDTLLTMRGTVRVSAEKGRLSGRLVMAELPRVASRLEGRSHRCAGHRDGWGGFAVLCRFGAKASRVHAANLTAVQPLEDVWTVASPRSTVVRLDLAMAPGAAEARAIGYLEGLTGVVLRAEATQLRGEPEARLALGATERSQPAAPESGFFGLR